MFDPTVWDNLKVVLEGALYDLDIDGEISILDRNDVVNLAKMSRTYEIYFKLNNYSSELPKAAIKLFADLENLAVELQQLTNRKPGCKLELRFVNHLRSFEKGCPQISDIVKGIWGDQHKIDQKVSFLYTNKQRIYTNELTVSFNRNIYEENIDDLLDMIPFILETLNLLAKIE